MNKAVASLGVSSLLLGAVTLYLARQVSLERQQPTHAPAGQSSPGNASRIGAPDELAATRAAQATSRSDESPNDVPGTGSPGAQPLKINSPGIYQQLQDEEMVASRSDAKLRRYLIEERIPIIRDQFLTLQRRLKIDDERWQRFMEVVAAQELGFLDAALDCKKSKTCDQPGFAPEQYARQKQELIDVLGIDHANAVENFRQASSERNGMQQIQAELAENAQIPEAQAEQLAEALAQIRMDAEKDMLERERNVGRYYQMGTSLLYDKGLPTSEARIEDATNYSRRLRAQAGKTLQGAPLAAFNRQQDRLLEQFREDEGKPTTGN